MTKYKIKRLGEKEVQALHKTKPIAVLVDGRPVQFFENEQKAQDMLIDQKNYDAVAEQLGKWVRAIADKRKMSDYEVWGMVHEQSEGPPRDFG